MVRDTLNSCQLTALRQVVPPAASFIHQVSIEATVCWGRIPILGESGLNMRDEFHWAGAVDKTG